MNAPLNEHTTEKLRLQLISVSKSFGGANVLSNINLKVKKGEVLALLGDNGAGKSTLIKMISGYHKPTKGQIIFDGKAIDLREFGPKKARSLGVQTVYQHLGLVDQLSIARNFFLGTEPKKPFLGITRLDHKKMQYVAKKELNKMGIRRALDPNDPVEKLSGGERQAIAISRARYFGAKLLILDEPTSALSLRQTNEVLGYIEKAASEGISVIFITHTLHHIEGLVNKITVLYHGEVVGTFSAGDISSKECGDLITKGRSESKRAVVRQSSNKVGGKIEHSLMDSSQNDLKPLIIGLKIKDSRSPENKLRGSET